MGERLSQLTQWVTEQAQELSLVLASDSLIPVSGDASFRRYFRARGADRNWIAVDAPPEHENSHPFVEIGTQWRRQGVRVPRVLAWDAPRGFMLLEDFGDSLLLGQLSPDSVEQLYGQAFAELQRIQAADPAALPAYDEALLRREMALFDDWFVDKLLGLQPSDDERRTLMHVEAALVANAREQLQVSVHRDYHSRNLMLLDDGGLGVIDYQDAVWGPVTYDLVSMLRDSYVRWPDEQVHAWVEGFRQRLLEAGQVLPEAELFQKQFDLMGMQRQLKVLGIFSRLYLRDGKPGYLNDIPRTLGYLCRAAARYTEFEALHAFLMQRVAPVLRNHPLFVEIDVLAELN